MRTHRAKSRLKTKLKSLSELVPIISRLKTKGKKIVFTNGCFDLLHYGHVKYLEDAKRKGDILVVGINRDCSIKKIKGRKRPIVSEKDRAYIIAALQSVDYVVLFKEDTPLKIIKFLKPDILVKGADWDIKTIVGNHFVTRYGGRVSTLNLVKGRSSTGLIKKIAQLY